MATRGTLRMVEAIFTIFRLLSSGSWSLRELAREVEASERTVQRYLREMRDRYQLAIRYDRERRGYVLEEGGLPMAQARLSDGELVALYVAAPVLAQYRGTPLEERFRAAFAKLCEHLPAKVVAHLPRLDTQLAVKAGLPSEDQVETFDRALSAVRRQRRVWMRYFSNYRGEETAREVDPYGVYQVGFRWYLVGYCHLRQNLRFFELSRIRALRLQPALFERPADFLISEVLRDSLGAIQGQGPVEDIILRFDTFAARYLRERKLHASQREAELPGGGLEVRLRVAVDAEVERLVLGWGEHVTVHSPPSLQQRILQRHMVAATRGLLGAAEERPPSARPADPAQLRFPFAEPTG